MPNRPALPDPVRSLTPRDRRLLDLLADHRVLTTSQVADVWGARLRPTQRRLATLWSRHLVDRFRPYTDYATGSAPYHWVLGPAGAAHVAAARDITVTQLGYTPRHTTTRIAASSHLAHQVGANGLFTALIRHTTTHPHASLPVWLPPGVFAARYPAGIRPDGYGRWRQSRHATEVAFTLEHDTGTEPLSRLADKLDRYPALTPHLGLTPVILFRFLTPGREHHARRALTDHPALRARQCLAATAVLADPPQVDPAGPIWRPLPATSPTEMPRRLSDLPTD